MTQERRRRTRGLTRVVCGRTQVQQVVGSIQKTNDLHVHMALIKCGSYFRKVR